MKLYITLIIFIFILFSSFYLTFNGFIVDRTPSHFRSQAEVRFFLFLDTFLFFFIINILFVIFRFYLLHPFLKNF